MKNESKIAAQINLIKLPANTKFEFEVDHTTEWIKSILVELNENATEKDPEAYLAETSFVVTGEIEKKNTPDLNEFLLVTGEIHATYATECVRTLKPMKEELYLPFKICFLEEELASSELYSDADDIWVESDVYTLYFFQKRTVNFQEMLHEQVFLNYNQYPILDAESKLDGLES